MADDSQLAVPDSEPPPRSNEKPRGQQSVCKDFLRGLCQRTNCKYYHDPTKVNICTDFNITGKCERSNTCRFRHIEGPTDGMGGAPPPPPMVVSAPPGVQSCKDFLRGKCSRGMTCRFFHDGARVCTDFIKGECFRRRGNSCKFSHDISRMAEPPECIHFKTGYCKEGMQCRFVHRAPDQMGYGRAPPLALHPGYGPGPGPPPPLHNYERYAPYDTSSNKNASNGGSWISTSGNDGIASASTTISAKESSEALEAGTVADGIVVYLMKELQKYKDRCNGRDPLEILNQLGDKLKKCEDSASNCKCGAMSDCF